MLLAYWANVGGGGGELVVHCCMDGEAVSLLLWGVVQLVACSLVELGEDIAEVVAEVGGAVVLLLEDRVLDNDGPYGAMLLVASLECTVLILCEGMALL